MHPVYTEVPQRSYDAYVTGNRPKLTEVMCAFVVDPDEAIDSAKEYGVRRTPHSLDVVRSMGAGAVDAALITISQWVSKQSGAGFAIEQIGNYDRHLGMWCVCILGPDVVKLLSSMGRREGQRVILLLKGWSKGIVSADEVMSAFDDFKGAYQYQLEANRYAYQFLSVILRNTFRLSHRDEKQFGKELRTAVDVVATGLASSVTFGEQRYDGRTIGRLQSSNLQKMVPKLEEACRSFLEPFDKSSLF